MFKFLKKIFPTFLLLLILVLLWNKSEQLHYNKDDEFYLPPFELTIFSEDIMESMELLNNKAKELNNEIIDKGFGLSSLKLAKENYLTNNTILVLQTYYQRSNDLAQSVVRIPKSFVGLTINELREISKSWEVKDFVDGKFLVFFRSLDELSPSDKERAHLGIRDGKVGIFYGESGDNLKCITQIQVEELSVQEQNNLKEGIIIDSNEELLSILDGFISEINKD